MKKGDYIFVYGTLRRGERADLSANSSQWGVSYVGEDKIDGAIYDTGRGYPGLKLDGHLGAVTGDLFRIRDESITALLDAYEGFPNLYNRSVVETANGVPAWVYTYNHGVSDAQWIESGDWKQRVAKAA